MQKPKYGVIKNGDKERRYIQSCVHIYRISLDGKQKKLLTMVTPTKGSRFVGLGIERGERLYCVSFDHC